MKQKSLLPIGIGSWVTVLVTYDQPSSQYNILALLPGHSHLQYLHTVSDQIDTGCENSLGMRLTIFHTRYKHCGNYYYGGVVSIDMVINWQEFKLTSGHMFTTHCTYHILSTLKANNTSKSFSQK